MSPRIYFRSSAACPKAKITLIHAGVPGAGSPMVGGSGPWYPGPGWPGWGVKDGGVVSLRVAAFVACSQGLAEGGRPPGYIAMAKLFKKLSSNAGIVKTKLPLRL